MRNLTSKLRDLLLRREILRSGLFDAAFYVRRYNLTSQVPGAAIAHFLTVGLKAGHRPSLSFDPDLYRKMYPDTFQWDNHVLLHYIRHGRFEHRQLPDETARLRHQYADLIISNAGIYENSYTSISTANSDLVKGHMKAYHRDERRPLIDINASLHHQESAVSLDSTKDHLSNQVILSGVRGHESNDRQTQIAHDVLSSGLFEENYYCSRYPEALTSTHGAFAYFIKTGLEMLHQPSSSFDPALYLKLNPDVAVAGESPLIHYIRHGRAEGRPLPDVDTRTINLFRACNLFDPAFYMEFYPDTVRAGYEPLDHYIRFGGKEGRRPSVEFDPAAYCVLYPEAAEYETALHHYLFKGMGENHPLPKTALDRESLELGRAIVSASQLFQPAFYLNRNPPIRWRGVDPILHFLVEGAGLFHDPSETFSTAFYCALFPELLESRVNPLLHYLQSGISIENVPLNMKLVKAMQKLGRTSPGRSRRGCRALRRYFVLYALRLHFSELWADVLPDRLRSCARGNSAKSGNRCFKARSNNHHPGLWADALRFELP